MSALREALVGAYNGMKSKKESTTNLALLQLLKKNKEVVQDSSGFVEKQSKAPDKKIRKISTGIFTESGRYNR